MKCSGRARSAGASGEATGGAWCTVVPAPNSAAAVLAVDSCHLDVPTVRWSRYRSAGAPLHRAARRIVAANRRAAVAPVALMTSGSRPTTRSGPMNVLAAVPGGAEQA